MVSARFWAQALWSTLEGFRAEIADFWFGHGCSGYRMHLEHERYYRLGMNVWLSYALGTRTLLGFKHGCSGSRMHSEHERYCGLSMAALVIGHTRNTKDIVVWA